MSLACGRPARHAGASEPVTCPHCGAGVSLATDCGGCSGGSGCALARCPECGASFPNPRGSGMAYRLSLWLGRRRARAEGDRDEYSTGA